jgi:tetratricopeptide (TPR) repeat protein
MDVDSLAKTMPAGELYAFTPVASLLRFGRWNEILAEPAPPAGQTLTTAVWLEARGFAHAGVGDLAAAKADQQALTALTGADFSRYADNNIPAHDMTDLALALLDGEIARRSGDLPGAITWFRMAADIEAKLPYSEPPYWHQPTSHLLGAVLLQAHRAAEAEAVYRESLKTYRGDGWALYGLTQALEAQGKAAEAAQTRKAFEASWKFADVTLAASRF